MKTIKLGAQEIIHQEAQLLVTITGSPYLHGILTKSTFSWCTLHGRSRLFYSGVRVCSCEGLYTVIVGYNDLVELLLQEIETGAREVETHKWRK